MQTDSHLLLLLLMLLLCWKLSNLINFYCQSSSIVSLRVLEALEERKRELSIVDLRPFSV